MAKTEALNIRIGAENKKQLTMAAHKCNCSLTEALLYSVNTHFVHHFIEMGKGWDRLYNALKDSDDIETREKAKVLTRESIEKAEYFLREANAIKDSSETLKEIEGLEAYRDFLSNAVTEKA